MARLQILELPAGSSDDQPPFILVVDECVPQRIALKADATFGDYWQALADRIGARGVIVTPETVDIPANDTSAYLDTRQTAPATVQVHIEGDAEEAVRRGVEYATRWYGPDEGKARDKDAELRAANEWIERLTADCHEARTWARHGYEIGQRHCGWTDHGVAPAWLTEEWPPHIDTCEHLKQAAEYDEALSRVRRLPEQPEIMDAQHPDSVGYLHGYGVAVREAKRATYPPTPATGSGEKNQS
ncbi:hypothetical protein ACF061_00690 [Streptomyces sp. NPDC015220]|uniref:hypothetical protein n=1 Tax=Streptomyces sp. NPDC015220 TaxID=3364947 RepID=UPI0036F9B027